MPAATVVSVDGTRIAVYERGPSDAPVVLAVHGYPDDHTVWDRVGDLLCDRFRFVTYDVRGAGRSERPTRRTDYRIERLVDDLVGVLDAVAPTGTVHLLAHDWGSVQSWDALGDARTAGRIAGFTSISGPSLDHAARWIRDVRTHPRASLRQLASSYYTVLFQLPRLPELAIRCGLVERSVGAPRDHDDARFGLELYRANLSARLRRPHGRRIDIPVQVIAPESDRYVTPALALGAPAPFVTDLRVVTIPGGHWGFTGRPELVADPVRAFVDDLRQGASA